MSTTALTIVTIALGTIIALSGYLWNEHRIRRIGDYTPDYAEARCWSQLFAWTYGRQWVIVIDDDVTAEEGVTYYRFEAASPANIADAIHVAYPS